MIADSSKNLPEFSSLCVILMNAMLSAVCAWASPAWSTVRSRTPSDLQEVCRLCWGLGSDGSHGALRGPSGVPQGSHRARRPSGLAPTCDRGSSTGTGSAPLAASICPRRLRYFGTVRISYTKYSLVAVAIVPLVSRHMTLLLAEA